MRVDVAWQVGVGCRFPTTTHPECDPSARYRERQELARQLQPEVEPQPSQT